MQRSRGATGLLLLFLLGSPACSATTDGSSREAWLSRLGGRSRPPAGRHLPLAPAELEKLMQGAAGKVRDRTPISSGVTGADRLTIYFPALGRSIRIKWKAAPAGDADGWNNTPRKELAAYAIQKWFLRPEAYVVPTTVARCIAVEDYRRLEPDAEPTLADTSCVFGVQAAWLMNVEVADPLYEEARFRSEPVYARHLANFNLFAYLIEDRDTRPANVLAAKDQANRRIFSVDNGISFDGRVYNFLESQWQGIQVPALPRDSIERLRKVTRERAQELATVAQFRRDPEGMLRPEPPEPPIDPSRGSRYRDGVLQLGLTNDEIEGVWKRLQDLLRRVDEQSIPLF